MALSGGTVRVLDATGKVAASGKAVTAASGAYGPIPLTGGGPYRVEACGTVGDKPLCLWGATTLGGTLNLTPMTSALTVLASGQAPDLMMNGAVQGLTDDALATAQTQLRAAIAPALADAGLASDFDLLLGAVKPGSHSGYDRVLDQVDVNFGADTNAFVTLAPRLGSGLAYLEPGTTQGSLSLDAAAASFDFAGVDALYAAMNSAMANNNSCQAGLTAVFDASARSTIETLTFSGPSQAAQLLCLRLNGTLGQTGEVLFGGKLLPALIDRCDFGAGDPVCRVGFVFQSSKGVLSALGVQQAVVKRPAGWRFLGNRLEVQASAAARLVLTRRVDSVAPDQYTRYLDITIPYLSLGAAGELQCARVSQKDGSGADNVLALYKKTVTFNGTAVTADPLLSLWSVSSSDGTPNLDPATGTTRGAGIVSLPLAGASGDSVARNFARVGRALKIELFSDSACATPLAGADGASLAVDLLGMPPLAATSMSGQPWPQLAAASGAALVSLKSPAATKINYGPIWTFSRGGIAMSRAQLCLNLSCSQQVVALDLPANATGAALSATVGTLAVNAADYKLLRLTARTADGLVLQMDSASCTTQTAGLPCK
jgi:hypothetical protein